MPDVARKSDSPPESGSRPKRASIRVVGGGEPRSGTVVEIVGWVGKNALLDVFVALQSVGVDIVHARVKAEPDGVTVQQFHLVESDGRDLTRRRLSRVLYRLARATGALPLAGERRGASHEPVGTLYAS